MNSRELRIGNLLNYDTGEGVEIVVIDWQDLKWISENDGSFNKDHSPIPLTEEWLLRFGFERTYHGYYSDNLVLRLCENNGLFYDYCGGDMCKGVEVKHVHQLQSLYFALTGKELTIKNDANN